MLKIGGRKERKHSFPSISMEIIQIHATSEWNTRCLLITKQAKSPPSVLQGLYRTSKSLNFLDIPT